MKLFSRHEIEYIRSCSVNKELLHSEERILDVYKDGKVVEWIIGRSAHEEYRIVSPKRVETDTKIIWHEL